MAEERQRGRHGPKGDGGNKGGRPANGSTSFELTGVEPKLLEYLQDLVDLQGYGSSKSAVARGFIWKEVNRLIEVGRLQQR
jgi:hypothetical protein